MKREMKRKREREREREERALAIGDWRSGRSKVESVH